MAHKRKKPVYWRPGKTPKFKPHPSVVRYRDPSVKSTLGVAFLDGATHAQFVGNPDCCEYCSRMDGTVRKIETLLNWIYVTAHANCRCHWIPGRMKGGSFVAE